MCMCCAAAKGEERATQKTTLGTSSNYLLISWRNVLLEQLTGVAAGQDISRIYGTRIVITILTSPNQLSLF
jgi:hypothetical protein